MEYENRSQTPSSVRGIFLARLGGLIGGVMRVLVRVVLVDLGLWKLSRSGRSRVAAFTGWHGRSAVTVASRVMGISVLLWLCTTAIRWLSAALVSGVSRGFCINLIHGLISPAGTISAISCLVIVIRIIFFIDLLRGIARAIPSATFEPFPVIIGFRASDGHSSRIAACISRHGFCPRQLRGGARHCRM